MQTTFPYDAAKEAALRVAVDQIDRAFSRQPSPEQTRRWAIMGARQAVEQASKCRRNPRLHAAKMKLARMYRRQAAGQ